jgi:hypothetical protein
VQELKSSKGFFNLLLIDVILKEIYHFADGIKVSWSNRNFIGSNIVERFDHNEMKRMHKMINERSPDKLL